jgi:hypothetical protein
MFYLTTLSDCTCIAWNGRVTNDEWWGLRKDAVVVYFKSLYRTYPGGVDENCRKLARIVSAPTEMRVHLRSFIT